MFRKLFGRLIDSNEAKLAKYRPIVVRTNALEPTFENLSDEQLKQKTDEFKNRLRSGESLDDLLPEAFAVVREAAKRSIGQRHYDVQLIGGIVLHEGKIAEMRTGEGKTLVATLPLYLNALSGRGAHLVTVNDFLAKFHAQWMGQIYHALGLTTAAIEHERSWQYRPETRSGDDETWQNLWPITRKEAYGADITYGTNNEFGFDYLRDNMATSLDQLVQRELHFAIIDEVDSILIDEARTPLIISAPAEESAQWYMRFAELVPRLKKDQDYQVDEKLHASTLTDAGIKKIEGWLGLPNLYDPEHITLIHHLEQSLKALTLYKKNKDYVIRDGEIIIVDEFTGRLMHGRRYSEGLHQAIEAKEGVEVKRESETLATISFQNLFRLYQKLAGMTGTAYTEKEEFWKIYHLDVAVVPTHRPMIRIDHQDRIYKTETAKFNAVVEEIKRRYERGQPLLVGTTSIAKNERLSRLLKSAGIKHQMLNAKHHEREAKVIAQAGRIGAVTVATNIAGRGVDIILGGTPPEKSQKSKVKSQKSTEETVAGRFGHDTGMVRLGKAHWNIEEWQKEHAQVIELGGLGVIGTERHEARRIDNQLRGRAGRQGDPGESVFFVSTEDDLMRIFGGDRMKNLMERLGLPDDVPIEHGMISKAIEQAQKKVEGHHFDIRKHLLEYDDVLNKHREAIYRKRRLILEGQGRNSLGETVPIHEELLDLMDDSERKKYEQKIHGLPSGGVQKIEQAVYLRVIDTFWVDHLNLMTELREGVGIRGYGQKDPLVEYKQEAYRLYQNLIRSIEDQVVELLLRLEIQSSPIQPVASLTPPSAAQLEFQGAQEETTGQVIEEEFQPSTAVKELAEGRALDEAGQAVIPSSGVTVTVRQRGQTTPTNDHLTTLPPSNINQFGRKIGRNEPCPCGSGKKFKKCHGR